MRGCGCGCAHFFFNQEIQHIKGKESNNEEDSYHFLHARLDRCLRVKYRLTFSYRFTYHCQRMKLRRDLKPVDRTSAIVRIDVTVHRRTC